MDRSFDKSPLEKQLRQLRHWAATAAEFRWSRAFQIVQRPSVWPWNLTANMTTHAGRLIAPVAGSGRSIAGLRRPTARTGSGNAWLVRNSTGTSRPAVSAGGKWGFRLWAEPPSPVPFPGREVWCIKIFPAACRVTGAPAPGFWSPHAGSVLSPARQYPRGDGSPRNSRPRHRHSPRDRGRKRTSSPPAARCAGSNC